MGQEAHVRRGCAGGLKRRPPIKSRKGQADASGRNRAEPDRATTRPKNAGRTASNRENYLSEPNRTDSCSKSPEPKRIEPSRFLPDTWIYTSTWHGGRSEFGVVRHRNPSRCPWPANTIGLICCVVVLLSCLFCDLVIRAYCYVWPANNNVLPH